MAELRPVFSTPDARDLILEAALGAFAEKGFHGAAMRDIAGRAGVSQSLVHHHFGNKEALWNLVGERTSADFLAYVAEAISPDVPPHESVPQAMRAYLSYWRGHPAAFRFNLWRLLEGLSDEREARSKTLNARAVPLMVRAQEAGFVRDDMPAGLPLIISGSLIQFWLHSQVEIRDAYAVTGASLPSDDAFIEIILDLIRAKDGRLPAGRSEQT